MAPTVHLTEPLPGDRTSIEAESVELKGSLAWIEPVDSADNLLVPVDNLAGVEGPDVDQDVEQIPTQGGQYSEVVTRIS